MGYFVKKEVERITLSTDPKYWVDVSTDITWADMKKMAAANEESVNSFQADSVLLTAIVGWNLDDDKGKVLPVSLETIDLLKRQDIEKIIAAVGGKIEDTDEEKKASS